MPRGPKTSFVCNGLDGQGSLQGDAGPAEDRHSLEDRGDGAFHVGAAPAPKAPFGYDPVEGRVAPGRRVAGGHHVEVAVPEERAAGATGGVAKAADDAGAPGGGLDEANTGEPEPGHLFLHPASRSRFVARRVGGVHANQRPGHFEQFFRVQVPFESRSKGAHTPDGHRCGVTLTMERGTRSDTPARRRATCEKRRSQAILSSI